MKLQTHHKQNVTFNFETTDVTGATASAKVVDFEDTTKVTVTTADVNENAENVTFNFETTNYFEATDVTGATASAKVVDFEDTTKVTTTSWNNCYINS